MKHSPAPWHTSPTYGHEVVMDKRGKMVADCCIAAKGVTQEMVEANARMVACCPEMREFVALVADGLTPSMEEARALLAKIDGEPVRAR